jgi:hypothetical protein
VAWLDVARVDTRYAKRADEGIEAEAQSQRKRLPTVARERGKRMKTHFDKTAGQHTAFPFWKDINIAWDAPRDP